MIGNIPTAIRISWVVPDTDPATGKPVPLDAVLAWFADVVKQKSSLLGRINVALALTVQPADPKRAAMTVSVIAPSLSDADLATAKADLAAYGTAVQQGQKAPIVSSVVTAMVS